MYAITTKILDLKTLHRHLPQANLAFRTALIENTERVLPLPLLDHAGKQVGTMTGIRMRGDGSVYGDLQFDHRPRTAFLTSACLVLNGPALATVPILEHVRILLPIPVVDCFGDGIPEISGLHSPSLPEPPTDPPKQTF